MIKTAVRYLQDIKLYFVKFSIVGLSGIFVNEGILIFLTEVLQMRVAFAGAISIEISILSNFTLNNIWTWRSRRQKKLWIRLLNYQMVTLVSGFVNYVVLLGLTYMGLEPWLANLFGIFLGTVINFGLNHYWTFRR